MVEERTGQSGFQHHSGSMPGWSGQQNLSGSMCYWSGLQHQASVVCTRLVDEESIAFVHQLV